VFAAKELHWPSTLDTRIQKFLIDQFLVVSEGVALLLFVFKLVLCFQVFMQSGYVIEDQLDATALSTIPLLWVHQGNDPYLVFGQIALLPFMQLKRRGLRSGELIEQNIPGKTIVDSMIVVYHLFLITLT
jgi:hypothetical protein